MRFILNVKQEWGREGTWKPVARLKVQWVGIYILDGGKDRNFWIETRFSFYASGTVHDKLPSYTILQFQAYRHRKLSVFSLHQFNQSRFEHGQN